MLRTPLLLKLSHAEDKCGKIEQALRLAEQARAFRLKLPAKPRRQAAWPAHGAWCCRPREQTEALELGERAVTEAEAADDPEAAGELLGEGVGNGELGKGKG